MLLKPMCVVIMGIGVSIPAMAQQVVQKGTVQRPVVQTVNMNMNIKAPASVLLPPFPTTTDTRAYKISQRKYEKQIRKIRFQYLGHKKVPGTRAKGLAELEQFIQPAALEPLIEVLRNEDEDVRDWLFEHLTYDVEPDLSQVVRTWLSIYDEDEWVRGKALSSLGGTPSYESMWLIDRALRVPNERVISSGALAAGQYKLIEAIPLLMATQGGDVIRSGGEDRGDLAWIFVGTQQFYVSDLIPIVGDHSAGFSPVLTPLNEGTLLVIQDAVVEFAQPRWVVHDTMLDLIELDYGKRVDFGFDAQQWGNWYEQEYAPFKERQRVSAEVGEPVGEKGDGSSDGAELEVGDSSG